MPDEDYYLTLPDREVMEAASEILGRSAEDLDRDAFGALQADVLAGELGNAMMPAFVDGLISAAARRAADRARRAPARRPRPASRGSLGLHIAAQIPLDDCADACLACLDDRRERIRARAVLAVRMLRAEVAVPALVRRLDDPDPGVCARAGLALVELGQDEVIRERRMPGELASARRVNARPPRSPRFRIRRPEVAGVLLPLVAGRAELADDASDEPLVEAPTSLVRGSADGIRIAAAFVREIPDALPILALALAGTDADPTPVVLRGELRAELRARSTRSSMAAATLASSRSRRSLDSRPAIAT